MKLIIDISKDRYDEIMSMDWKNCRLIFAEELRAIHDGKTLEQEPCGDCISREYVIKLLENTKRTRKEITNRIYEVQSVSPQPKIGHWEWNQYDANPRIGNFHCSLCHSIGRTYFDYCPYCGAKMSEIPTGQIVANGELYSGEFDDSFAEEGSDKE